MFSNEGVQVGGKGRPPLRYPRVGAPLACNKEMVLSLPSKLQFRSGHPSLRVGVEGRW